MFYGDDLLNSIASVAAAGVFANWAGVPTEGIAPTGMFTDILGNPVTLYSQVDDADQPGGGPRFSYISTSFEPGDGTTVITDPNPGGGGGTDVPEPGSLTLLGAGLLALWRLRRRNRIGIVAHCGLSRTCSAAAGLTLGGRFLGDAA